MSMRPTPLVHGGSRKASTPGRRDASRLRILVLTSASVGGGAQRAAFELCQALRHSGAEVTVFAGRRRPGDPTWVRAIRLGIEDVFHRIDRTLCLDSDLRHVGSILRLSRVQRTQFDVVHFHNLRDSRGGWVSLRAARSLARRVPAVWTFHDEWPVVPGLIADLQRAMPPHVVREVVGEDELYRDHPLTLRRQRWMRRALPRPAAIVCPSRYMAHLAADSGLYSGVPVHHVPNGLAFLHRPETRIDRAAARQMLGLPPQAPIVLLVAPNLEAPIKGPALAVSILARLTTPGARLLAIGNASRSFRDAIQLPATFTGYLPPDDARLVAAYRAADVTLMPSISDNFPYVALESLACETPVAAFRVGGLPEIVGLDHRGRLAPPFDCAALAAAVDELLGDAPARRAAGMSGRRWAMETCNPGRATRAHLRIYREAMSACRHPEEGSTSIEPIPGAVVGSR